MRGHAKLNTMNILLTSAGRRTYLCDYFKQALKRLPEGGLVFASNSGLSPALLHADRSVISPLIYSEEYIPFLLELCRNERIGLLVPLFDIDLPVLAAHREEFLQIGTVPAVSEPEVIAACNDKVRMEQCLRELGIDTPRLYNDAGAAGDFQKEDAAGEARNMAPAIAGKEDVSFDRERGAKTFIVKPRFGMGSISVLRAEGEEELRGAVSMCRRAVRESYLRYESAWCPGQEVLVSECIEGQEYGLDVINDFECRTAAVIVRKKLGMRAGETDEAVILGENDPEYAALHMLGLRLSKGLCHRGCLDADVMMDRDGTPYVIDLNARFGGGYPFSHAAGADLPRAYAAWAGGEAAPAECFQVRPGTHAYKDIAMGIYAG